MYRALTVCALAAIALGGCERPVSVGYDAPAAVRPSFGAVIGRVVVTDDRDRAAGEVGNVMFSDGKPLKRLVAADGAAATVAAAARDALSRRGAYDEARGRYTVQIDLLNLNAEQWTERQAQLDMIVRLIAPSGRAVFTTRAYAERRGDDWIAVDDQLLGSPQGLADVESATLSDALDRLIDRTGMLARG